MTPGLSKNILAILATVIFTILSCHAGAATILVIGDSLSAAYGIAKTDGWVSLLQARLLQNDPSINVINASISGETTTGGLARLPAALQRSQPDIVILELGANDGLRGYPIHVMKKNLTGMIELARQAGASVLLVGMQIPPNYGRRYTESFQNAFSELARDHRLALVPFLLDGVAGNDKLTQADGLHPAAAAQPIILENVLPHVLKQIHDKTTGKAKPHLQTILPEPQKTPG